MWKYGNQIPGQTGKSGNFILGLVETMHMTVASKRYFVTVCRIHIILHP